MSISLPMEAFLIFTEVIYREMLDICVYFSMVSKT